jgi:hypothetical protein
VLSFEENKRREILEYLNKVKHIHYARLKSEYALAQEFEDFAGKNKVVT